MLAKRSSPISFTNQVPATFRGETQVPNVALRQLAKPAVDARQSAVIGEMYRNTTLAGPVIDGFSTRDGVIICDAKARIESVNRAFTEITGYAPEAVEVA